MGEEEKQEEEEAEKEVLPGQGRLPEEKSGSGTESSLGRNHL